MSTTIVWFRHDLRLADNPALYSATEREGAILPVFIWAPEEEGDWPPGAAHRWWLHYSLTALRDDLKARGSDLVLRCGPTLDSLRDLIDATGAERVYWNRRYEPNLAPRDKDVQEALEKQGIEVRVYESQILHDPDAVQTTSGGSYHVFTPFWKKIKSRLDIGAPLEVPVLDGEHAPDTWPPSSEVDDLDLLPTIDWAGGLRETWTPGEAGAHERLRDVLSRDLIKQYDTDRDRPDEDGTSRLSPYLHHGELSPRQVWHAVSSWADEHDARADAEPYLRQVAWREFSYHMLHHYPHTPSETYRDKFKDFGWRHDNEHLERWQKGQTGFPIVDAGMRQLWHTGWMHNRVRLLVGSFLTKDLLLAWQHGAEWFWDCLVDGNLASNTMGWQWVAGSGADAQPFFRIFNPISQAERYDPNGRYVRAWVPELRKMPDDYIHHPWDAPAEVLSEAGVALGADYPQPIVDHSEMRDEAMAEYNKIK